MLVLKGTKRQVKSVAFSPDGRMLASSAEDCQVRLWNALDGSLLATLAYVDRHVKYEEFNVLFAPDNRHLITSHTRYKLTVWDVTERKLVKKLIPESNYSIEPCPAFAPDGRLLALRDDVEQGLYAWDPVTWEQLPVLWRPAPGETCNALALEPGGRRAALENGLILDVVTGKVLGRWGERVDGYWVRGGATMAWCPKKPLLAFRCGPGTIDVVNPLDTKLVIRLVVSKKHVEGFRFTPDGGHLIVACNDKAARLYDTGTWAARQTLEWGIGGLRSVAVAADGSRAAAGSAVSTYSGKIVIWDLD